MRSCGAALQTGRVVCWASTLRQSHATGIEGSASTVHANSPRDAFSRLEAMVLMSDIDLPSRVIQQQLASAIRIVVQVSRLQDGTRKVTNISEVRGLRDDRIQVEDIFYLERTGVTDAGKVQGRFRGSGETPQIVERFKTHGLEIPASVFHEVVEISV